MQTATTVTSAQRQATHDGFYSLNWKPDIAGKYTVYATFAASESYYGHHMHNSLPVDEAAATHAPTNTTQPISS